MSRLYLPIGSNHEPYPNPQTRKQELLNRLWRTRTLIPGARNFSEEELRDHVQKQEAKYKTEIEKSSKIAQRVVSQYEHDQVIGAIKEYLEWRRKRKNR